MPFAAMGVAGGPQAAIVPLLVAKMNAAGFLAAGTLLRFAPQTFADEPYEPKVAAASNQGEQAIARIKVPEGFKVQLWAIACSP